MESANRTVVEGVHEDAAASEALAALVAFEKVKNVRSSAAIHYYAREFGCSDVEAEEVFVELLKFMSLAASSSLLVAPSDQLDEMWHAFIIQTKEYAEFAERLGKFVNHSTTAAPRESAYDKTLIAYRAAFGEPHAVWLTLRQERVAPSSIRTYTEEGDCVPCRVAGWCSCTDD